MKENKRINENNNVGEQTNKSKKETNNRVLIDYVSSRCII